MKKPHKSIRVFANPHLEKLTHVHPVIPLVMWVPVVLFLFYRSWVVLGQGGFAVACLGLLGLFVWTVTEYLLHRFIFHFAAHGPLQSRIQFLIHGLHHDDPQDPTRLVMPPVPGIILGILLFTAFRALFLLLGAPDATLAFFGGFVIGYLCYDYIHYGIHHFTPRSRLGKWIKQHHMLHHFATPHARWGVSSPFWDYVFGTVNQPERRRAAPDASHRGSDAEQPV